MHKRNAIPVFDGVELDADGKFGFLDENGYYKLYDNPMDAFANAEPVGVQVHNLSLSAGMTLLSAGDDLDEALQRADQALYRAKRGGRNRCDAAWEGAGA